MAKALNVPFEIKKKSQNKVEEDDQLYGEGFRKSIEEGHKAFEENDMDQFSEIKRQDLWNKI